MMSSWLANGPPVGFYLSEIDLLMFAAMQRRERANSHDVGAAEVWSIPGYAGEEYCRRSASRGIQETRTVFADSYFLPHDRCEP